MIEGIIGSARWRGAHGRLPSALGGILFIEQVPHSFDSRYLYGVGMIESEFFGEAGLAEPSAGELNFFPCMEFMLSETPRKGTEHEQNKLG